MQKIYLGPSSRKFKNFDLKNLRVYSDNPTAIIAELEKLSPLAGKLFVPIENFLQAQEELKNPAAPISIAYKQIANLK